MFTIQDRDFLSEIQTTNPEIYDFITHLQKETAQDIKIACHDICNIVSLIFGNFQLLELTNAELKNCPRWNQIKDDIYYLVHTMEEINTYRYSHTIEPFKIDINNFISLLISSITTNNKYSSLHLQFHTTSSITPILVDTKKILYIIYSILDNLIEINPNANVNIITECTDTNFYIKVSDDISVISNEIRNNLFQPFNTDKQLHSGLSLASSYQIMLAHNGSLDYISNSEKGHTFVLSFKCCL